MMSRQEGKVCAGVCVCVYVCVYVYVYVCVPFEWGGQTQWKDNSGL